MPRPTIAWTPDESSPIAEAIPAITAAPSAGNSTARMPQPAQMIMRTSLGPPRVAGVVAAPCHNVGVNEPVASRPARLKGEATSTDAAHRERFVEPLLEELVRGLGARDAYVTGAEDAALSGHTNR